ncbi:MAG: HAMP domain-containing protein [Armatimonadetes bacterium]|nr:HAMP domain-containing protein [Armatimonadota bacterium]
MDDVRRRLQAYYLIVLAVLLQGLSPVLTKLLLRDDGLSASTTVAARYVIAVLFLLPFGVPSATNAVREGKPRRRDWIALIFVGGFGSALGALLFTKALETAPAGVVNALSKTAPIFVAFIAYYTLRERISSVRFTLVFVMVAADVLIGLGEYKAAATSELGLRLGGDVLAVLAGLSRALAEILSKGTLRRFSPTTVALARFGVGAVVGAIACIGGGAWGELAHLSLRGWLILIGLGGICTSLSMSIYLRGLAEAQAHVAVSLRLLGAIVTVIFSWVILQESLHPLHVAGIAILVFTSYIIVTRAAHVPEAPRPTPEEERGTEARIATEEEIVPRTPSRLSLKLKIASVVVVVVFVTMFASSTLSLQHTEAVVRQELRLMMGQIATNVAQLQQLPDPPARQTLQAYSERIVRQEIKGEAYSVRIVFLAILDERGHISAFAVNPRQLELADESRRAYREGDMAAAEKLVAMAVSGELDRKNDLLTVRAVRRAGASEAPIVVMGSRKSLARRPLEEVRSRAVFLTLVFVLLGIMAAIHFAGTITGPLERLARAMRRVRRGDLDVGVVPEGNDEIEDLGHAFNDMVDGLRVKNLLDHAFSAYVSRQVTDRIVAEREIVFAPQRRKVTVMFADIRGFTPLAERLGPEQVFEILNEYFELMIEVVFRHDGMLDKYMGDSIMAVWGAFGEEQDDSLRAVLAAIEMKQAIRELNGDRVAEGKEPVETGFGINTGEVTAGSLGALGGDLKRMEYAVVGDPVNLAQRIESHTASTGILISDSTYAEVAEHVVVRALAPLTVRGKSTQVPVYLVMGFRGGEMIYTREELAAFGLPAEEIDDWLSRRTLGGEGE